MANPPTPKSAALQREANNKKAYLHKLQELEFAVRHKVDPTKILSDLDTFRSL